MKKKKELGWGDEVVWDRQTVTAHLGWERLTAGTPHRAECCTCSSSTIRKWNYLSRARKKSPEHSRWFGQLILLKAENRRGEKAVTIFTTLLFIRLVLINNHLKYAKRSQMNLAELKRERE